MKLIKRLIPVGLIFALLLSCSVNVYAKPSWPNAPGITSDGGILMDASTGAILYQKNVDTQMYPASISKIMTILLVLENLKMDEVVTFSRDAVYSIEFGSNHIGCTVGEELTVEQCLYGICLNSANEVCNAVGEKIAGSIDGFVELMNKRAKELGCKNTHFANPNGLHDKEHYSSARDLAIITKECLKYDAFRKIAGTNRYDIPPTNNTAETRYLLNDHKMFKGRKQEYEGFECGKTGFTDQALNTLISVAKRGDVELICVTLHGNLTHYTDTATLFDYGFANYSSKSIGELDSNLSGDYYVKNESTFQDFVKDATEYSFTYDKDAKLLMPKGASFSDYEIRFGDATIKDNELAGNLEYYYDNELMGNLPVKITKKLNLVSGVKQFSQNNSLLFNILKGIVIIIIVLVVLYILLLIYAKRRRRKRRQQRRRRR